MCKNHKLIYAAVGHISAEKLRFAMGQMAFAKLQRAGKAAIMVVRIWVYRSRLFDYVSFWVSLFKMMP